MAKHYSFTVTTDKNSKVINVMFSIQSVSYTLYLRSCCFFSKISISHKVFVFVFFFFYSPDLTVGEEGKKEENGLVCGGKLGAGGQCSGMAGVALLDTMVKDPQTQSRLLTKKTGPSNYLG